MNDDLLQRMISFISTAGNVNVALFTESTDNESEKMERVGMINDTAEGFRQLAIGFIEKKAKKITNYCKYNPGYIPEDHECSFIEVEFDKKLNDEIKKTDPTSALPPYAYIRDELKFIKYYVVIVEDNSGNRALLYSTFGDANVLERKGKFPITFSQNSFRKLEKGLIFSDNIDCIFWNGVLYICNQRNFERIFKYIESLKQIAIEEGEKIKNALTIINQEDFEDVISKDMGIIRKLGEMRRNESIENLNTAKVEKAIKNFDLNIEFNKKDKTIVFDKKVQNRWQFFKLLNEDYFLSQVTPSKFIANSKKKIS